MCTTSLEMATVRDGHYHLLCFWTQQRVVRFSFLLTLNVCFVPLSFTWSWLWHASWVNVCVCWGEVEGALNCLEMTLTMGI